MSFQSVFKRYEMKYLMTAEQKARILNEMLPHMQLDQYGRSIIRNVYFDTDDYRLIRRSIEKPVYKEKLRIRSYGVPIPGEPIYVELKKKYQSVVYKRRLRMEENEAVAWLSGIIPNQRSDQIACEINYFRSFYAGLHPVAFLSYEREAYYSTDQNDLRITFDDNVLCRLHDLSVYSDISGTALLPEGNVLMEVKTCGALPLWLSHALCAHHIYKTSFSKYGTAYQNIILPEIRKGYQYA